MSKNEVFFCNHSLYCPEIGQTIHFFYIQHKYSCLIFPFLYMAYRWQLFVVDTKLHYRYIHKSPLKKACSDVQYTMSHFCKNISCSTLYQCIVPTTYCLIKSSNINTSSNSITNLIYISVHYDFTNMNGWVEWDENASTSFSKTEVDKIILEIILEIISLWF